MDNIGFNWTVFIAVSAGFLASSYTIFSSNIITPALQYVYAEDFQNAGKDGKNRMEDLGWTIDMVTIGTTTVGMLIFGHLADRLGRKRLYGIELFIIILGTIGMIMASDGFFKADEKDPSKTNRSMDIYAAVAAWRGIQGLGIGAEYPLSAVIAAEFSSTQTRGTLMASMFAMQSVGRVLAYIVTLGAVSSQKKDALDHRVEIDGMWRLVVGISAIPALLAIGLRLTIPETPRYYAGIEKNIGKAVKSVEQVGGKYKDDDLQSIHSDIMPTRGRGYERSTPWFSSMWSYLFGKDQAWKPLVGVSFLWFLLDIAFYGLGLDSPATVHRLFLSAEPKSEVECSNIASPTAVSTIATLTLEGSITTTITQLIVTPTATLKDAATAVITATSAVATNPAWNANDANRCATISESLKETAIRTLLLTSIASMFGSLAAIVVINYVSRKRLIAVTSGILCVLFFAAGISVNWATETQHSSVSMVFFALSQFMFNLGPNTLTFIIAAESFPTVFRGTFHGFASASGKVGALVIRLAMHYSDHDKEALRNVMFGFCAVTLVMAACSLIPGWVSDIQHPRGKAPPDPRGSLAREETGWKRWIPQPLKNKSLEEIAPNPDSSRMEERPTKETVEEGIGKAGDDGRASV